MNVQYICKVTVAIRNFIALALFNIRQQGPLNKATHTLVIFLLNEKKNVSHFPIHTFEVDGGIAPAELLCSDSGETSPHQNTLIRTAITGGADQMAFIQQDGCKRGRLVDLLLHNHCPHTWIKNLTSPCWTCQIFIHVWLA